MTGTHEFVVVANRYIGVDEPGETPWHNDVDGPLTALQVTARTRSGIWVSAAGAEPAHPEIEVHPVSLTGDEVASYHAGQANAAIWPIYHDAVQDPVFRPDWRHTYREVNRRFAETVAGLAAPRATVWILGHDLQQVPGMLRRLRPNIRIGFFLPIPFPPVELFLRIPHRAELLRGLLGADTVGFQTSGAADNFRRAARQLLGLFVRGDQVITREQGSRAVTAAAVPTSVDVADIEGRAADPAVIGRARRLRARLGDPRLLLLGVDRLEHTAGIEQRLTAFEALLAGRRPDSSGTVLVQIALPSHRRGPAQDELRHRIEHLVARINGDHARVGQPPVHYLHRSLSPDDLVALYLAADQLIATPLRDGMNHVAKEYLAARLNDTGAVILSELTGAATELRAAHLVNPYDIDAVKSAILAAATESRHGAGLRIQTLRHLLRTHDVHAWARRLVRMLDHRSAPDTAIAVSIQPTG